MKYPDLFDAQVMTPWPIVDQYREAYRQAHTLRLATERARTRAERALSRANRHTAYSDRMFTEYRQLAEQLPHAEYRAWTLHGQAKALGEEVNAALERARRTVEQQVTYRDAAREADLEAGLDALLGD